MFTSRRLWSKAVRHVLSVHGLPAGPIASTFPGSCPVFLVNAGRRPLLVKYYPPMCIRDWTTESASLDAVGRRGRPPVPKIVARGVLDDRTRWPYLVLSPLAGRPLREVWRRIPVRDRLAVLTTAGRMLGELHQIRPPSGVAPLDLAKLARDALRAYRKAGVFRPALLREMAVRFRELGRSVAGSRRSLLHADLNEDHVIARSRDGRWRVTGFIDFGDAQTGDPLYEWMPSWYGLLAQDPAYFKAFQRGYRPRLVVTPAWRERAAAFVLAHRFGPPTILRALEQLGVRPSTLRWPALRDLIVPPALERRPG
jgi:hygromycin-B 7''-O-kinase